MGWILTAAFVVAALVAAIAQPTHWKRTLVVAVVLAVVSAAFAATRRKGAESA